MNKLIKKLHLKRHGRTRTKTTDQQPAVVSRSKGGPSTPTKQLEASQQDTQMEEENGNTAAIAPLTDVYNKEVRPYIDLIDKLRSEGLDQDVSLPAVAVIGDQSAGKSSTLEAISGIQLPRGTGIVTRCPLVLRLKSSVNGDQEWRGRINYTDSEGHHHSKDIHSPQDVGDCVLQAQNRITGTETFGISDSLITLDVESQDVPDLTLIDLPGITRVAVPGQPPDIPEQIKRLIKARITQEETIILAVIPANVDIATTEALHMAHEIDADGSRTLGVITKPDLIDRGTESELIAVLTNQRVPLAKGYTVVKCRGQQNIRCGQMLADALADEQRFFDEAEHFRHVDPNLLGVRNLSLKLTGELVNQIIKTLPTLKAEVSKKKQQTTWRLLQLGSGIPQGELQKKLFLLEILQGFCVEVVDVCKGDYGPDCPPDQRLFTQARRHYDKLIGELAGETPALLSSEYIETIIRESEEARAGELPRFMNYRVFQKLVVEVVRGYESHCSRCLNHVDRLVEEILTNIADKHFTQFQRLGGEIKLTASKLRRSARETCGERIGELFEMESIIYTQDRIFIHDLENQRRRDSGQSAYTVNSPPTAQPSKQEVLSYGHQLTSADGAGDQSDYNMRKQEAQDMYSMIMAYLEVCTRRIVDYVPLTIQLHLIRRLSEALRLSVMSMLSDPDSLELIYENPRVVSEREALEHKLERLSIAEEELIKF